MKHHFQVKTKDLLVWEGWVVMSRSETPLMILAVRLLADSEPKIVLEIGYGLGMIFLNSTLKYILTCVSLQRPVQAFAP